MQLSSTAPGCSAVAPGPQRSPYSSYTDKHSVSDLPIRDEVPTNPTIQLVGHNVFDEQRPDMGESYLKSRIGSKIRSFIVVVTGKIIYLG